MKLIKKLGTTNKWMAVAPNGTSLGVFMNKLEAIQVAQKAKDEFFEERLKAGTIQAATSSSITN